ncbi:MAG: NAD(P)H-dependent oxidoreductase subunit E, partial [Flavobacteriaceae bacterium]|nr:NAD(P)H-dependent oxidoreductase subunit E [Flavobacteriaceae bacterium]
MANKNIRSLSYRKGLDDNLFENISELARNKSGQQEYHKLAERFMVDDSVVLGTSTFYDFLKPENQSKKVFVCNGTACMVAGTQNALVDNLGNIMDASEIGEVPCLGHCHENHAFLYDDKTYSAKKSNDLEHIIKSKAYQEHQYAVGCNSEPILTAAIENVRSFFSLADTFKNNPEKVIEELKRSNLRGRGGAGFPFYFKLDAVFKEPKGQKYVVCNADEGDPGAYSDMYLMEHQPHKVLFG